MRFLATKLRDIFEIEIEPIADERGFFARAWCEREFTANGLNGRLAQCNLSGNARKGTLRGIHFQAAPHEEAKLVRCIRGRIFDVAVDLRPDSDTYLQWHGVELTATNHRALYIPEGCGHGFLTLEDDTELYYQMSEFYHPEVARGVRWNDPALRITWPSAAEVISDRDRTYPDYQP